MPYVDTAWRCRLMIFGVVSLLLVGDLFGGYGGSVRGVKSDHPDEVVRGGPPTAPATSKFQQENADIEIGEDRDFNELSAASALKSVDDTLSSDGRIKTTLAKAQLSDTIKESCLPKMLCELAAKPEYMLSEKEKELLRLIRSPTMPWMMNSPPSKWYFAAHMGELLRFTGDELSGPMGCANLWPNCPISSKKLMKLSYKVRM